MFNSPVTKNRWNGLKKGLVGCLLLANCSQAWSAPTPKADKTPTATPPPVSAGETSTSKMVANPFQWMDDSTVAWGVVQARKEDVGFKALLKTAWQEMRNTSSANSWLNMMNSFLSTAKQEDVLLGFLPFQGVRVDRLDASGQDHSGTMVSIGGWPGLQSLFWGTLLNDPSGKPYRSEFINGQTLVLRPKPGQKPEEGPAVARVRGNFYAFSDPTTAKSCLNQTGPAGAAYDIAKSLDTKDQDTYGVVINRQDSLVRFFIWVDRYDYDAVAQAYGPDKLKEDINKVKHLTWTGDLKDDDVMEFEFRFVTGSEDHAEAVGEMLKQARRALKARGRAADLQLTTLRNDVIVRVQMIGYRQLLQNYLKAQSQG